MFTINDLWKIYNVIQDDDNSDLGNSLIALAKSEAAKTNSFFTNTIDMTCFNTSDYKRLRSFLTTWYASLKTITSTQSKASDPFSLSDEHLDELFKSFGYHYSNGINLPGSTTSDKVNLFLDLVNLYKIKGTPRSVVEVLSYYGLTNIDLFEYWLEKTDDDNNPLQFRGKNIIAGTTYTDDIIIDYDIMVADDPHWFLNKSGILTSFDNNKINLPSKSPYFSIRPGYDASYIVSFMNIIARKSRDEYNEYITTGSIIDQSIISTGYGASVSLLETYLSAIYIYNKSYPSASVSQNIFNCYDGTNFENYIDIINDYNSLTNTRPVSRENRNELLETLIDTYSRNKSSDFLINKDDAGTILQTINPTLYEYLNYTYETSSEFLLMSLLLDMSDWLRNVIGPSNFNISYFIYGLSAFVYDIGDVINFFKPYHARLKYLELFEINSCLQDSIVIEDNQALIIENTSIDFDTAAGDLLDSTSQEYITYFDKECPDGTNSNCCEYRRDFYDHGSYYDIGASTDNLSIVVEQNINENVFCLLDGTGSVYFEYTFGIFDGLEPIDLEYKIFPQLVVTGGFENFDESGTFDCLKGCDVFEIYIDDPLYAEDNITCLSDGTAAIHFDRLYDGVDYSDGATVIEYNEFPQLMTDSGFEDFDESGIFDCLKGYDIFEIYMEDDIVS